MLPSAIAGLLSHIRNATVFFNNSELSYKRFGEDSAPRNISWAGENRGQLIRIPPSGKTGHHYAQLRSPDALANPYLAIAMMIYSCLDGIENKTELPASGTYIDSLPGSLEEAKKLALSDPFVISSLGEELVKQYCR